MLFWVAIDVETKELVAIYVSSLGALWMHISS
jgi:hypothetical protein